MPNGEVQVSRHHIRGSVPFLLLRVGALIFLVDTAYALLLLALMGMAVPGEYVAAGAAVQAAWALTGARPEWPVEIVAAPASDPRPEIRAAYAAARP